MLIQMQTIHLTILSFNQKFNVWLKTLTSWSFYLAKGMRVSLEDFWKNYLIVRVPKRVTVSLEKTLQVLWGHRQIQTFSNRFSNLITGCS